MSAGGVHVKYDVSQVTDADKEVDDIITSLDDHKGVLLTSSYEFPGRYARWTVGFTSPPIQIEGKGYDFKVTALNERGVVLSDIIRAYLKQYPDMFQISSDDSTLTGMVLKSDGTFAEEDRSKQASLFSLVRAIKDLFYGTDAGQLGLYGALGYDLTFQFEPIVMKTPRDSDQRDLVMYLPDSILVVDNQKRDSWKISYDFTDITTTKTTTSIDRAPAKSAYIPADIDAPFVARDIDKGKYAESVVRAKQEFKVGNLFEVVLSQSFREKMKCKPSVVFRRLCKRNPSPYGFFINLGSNEYLVGASPEMFVRVENTMKGMRVETCPISGTIERGGDPLEDA